MYIGGEGHEGQGDFDEGIKINEDGHPSECVSMHGMIALHNFDFCKEARNVLQLAKNVDLPQEFNKLLISPSDFLAIRKLQSSTLRFNFEHANEMLQIVVHACLLGS